MTRDPDYKVNVYSLWSGEAGVFQYLARVDHPRTKLSIFFEGATSGEVIKKAESFWAEYQQEREAAWAKQDAAKLARELKAKEKKND